MFVSATPAGSLRSEVQLDQNAVFEWNIQISIAQMFSFAWQNICFLIFTPFQRWKHKANLFSHKRKRSNILFFQVWKWVNKRNRFFWWKKIVHGKKGKIHLRNQNSFFFFYVWVVKLFLFSSTCVLPLESFQVGFFPICENSHTKMHETENKFSQMKKKNNFCNK